MQVSAPSHGKAIRDKVMRRLGLALLVSSLLSGCLSTEESYYDAPKALDKMSPEERCNFYAHYISNPQLSQQAKSVATQEMRAKGCPVT